MSMSSSSHISMVMVSSTNQEFLLSETAQQSTARDEARNIGVCRSRLCYLRMPAPICTLLGTVLVPANKRSPRRARCAAKAQRQQSQIIRQSSFVLILRLPQHNLSCRDKPHSTTSTSSSLWLRVCTLFPFPEKWFLHKKKKIALGGTQENLRGTKEGGVEVRLRSRIFDAVCNMH